MSLLSPETTHRSTGVKVIPVDRIESNPEQPRLAFDETTLEELAASIREHGVLQPILVRPIGENHFQLIAGERRWRASRIAGMASIPALVEDIDDDTALEISIIENLQREDISPLDEAAMYDRMIRDHGYSIRKLADKLGKDKGYLENRLRLADAPPEVRELVSLRKDTLSHAYELMKVSDPRKRKKLAGQVARNELSLVKLRERIEGRPSRQAVDADLEPEPEAVAAEPELEAEDWTAHHGTADEIRDDSLVVAKQQLNAAVEDLLDVIRNPEVLAAIGVDGPVQPGQVPHDRQAPPRERDRRGADRGPGPLGLPSPGSNRSRRHNGAGFMIPAAQLGKGGGGWISCWPPWPPAWRRPCPCRRLPCRPAAGPSRRPCSAFRWAFSGFRAASAAAQVSGVTVDHTTVAKRPVHVGDAARRTRRGWRSPSGVSICAAADTSAPWESAAGLSSASGVSTASGASGVSAASCSSALSLSFSASGDAVGVAVGSAVGCPAVGADVGAALGAVANTAPAVMARTAMAIARPRKRRSRCVMGCGFLPGSSADTRVTLEAAPALWVPPF